VAVDITKRVEVADLVKKAIDTYGKIDVLVNNASNSPLMWISMRS
jgi:NADP-dependent 3-hydroxy acid dehydrogenase YdfG